MPMARPVAGDHDSGRRVTGSLSAGKSPPPRPLRPSSARARQRRPPIRPAARQALTMAHAARTAGREAARARPPRSPARLRPRTRAKRRAARDRESAGRGLLLLVISGTTSGYGSRGRPAGTAAPFPASVLPPADRGHLSAGAWFLASIAPEAVHKLHSVKSLPVAASGEAYRPALEERRSLPE